MRRKNLNWFDIIVWTIAAIDAAIIIYCIFSSYGRDMRKEGDDYVIALFTIILGGGAIVQGMYLARQDMRIKTSIDDAKMANKAQLRAYLSIENATQVAISSIDNPNTGAYSLNLSFAVKNRGQTPALNARIKIFPSKEQPSQSEIQGYLKSRNANLDILGVIHSSAEIIRRVTPLRHQRMDDDFNKVVSTTIVVEYADVFGDHHHEVRTGYFTNVNAGAIETLYPQGCIST